MKMKDRVALNEVKNLSKEMYETFLRYNKGISNFMEYFFKYHALKFPEIQIFREENEDFLDDGNTRTAGFTWSAYWIVPLSENEVSVSDVRSGYGNSAIVFHMENYDQRLFDGRIGGIKSFSLSFSFGSYIDLVKLSDGAFIQNNSKRLDFQNNNYNELALLNRKENYLKLIICLNKLNEVKN